MFTAFFHSFPEVCAKLRNENKIVASEILGSERAPTILDQKYNGNHLIGLFAAFNRIQDIMNEPTQIP